METNFIEMELEDLENTDLICPYCNRKVDILNENLQFSIDEHSQLPFHIRAYKLSQKNNTVQSDAQEQNQHKIDLIFKNILKKFKNDKTYLTVLNDNIFCNLCCFEITHEDNLNFKLIEEHLGGKMHATYLNVIGSNSNIICGENISDSELLYEMLSDGDVFSNLPHELSVNRYFIFMNHDGRYFCQLCEILIEVNNESVLKHIKSKVHVTIVDQKYDNGSVIFENSRKFKHLEDYDQLENTECASINEQQYTTLSQQDVQLGAVPISIINEHYGIVEQRHDKSSVENSIKFQPLEDYSQLDNTECLSINEITEQQYTLSQQDVQLASVPINEHYELVRSKRRSKRRNKNPIESSKTFQHLEDYGQLETNKIKKHQYSTLSQQDVQLAAVPISTTVNKDYDDLVNQFEESLPKIFEKNKLFIVKFNTNYKCCLCNVKLIFNRNISKLISNFKQHLNTLRHKQAVRKYFGLKPITIQVVQDGNETRSSNKLKPANSLVKSKAEKGFPSKESPKPIANNISFGCLNSKVDSFSHTGTNEKNKSNGAVPKLTMNYTVPFKFPQISKNSKIMSDYECLKKIFYPFLPREIEKNQKFIVKITDNEFCCILCRAKFCITSNVDSAIRMLCQHFKGKKHVENIELKNQNKLNDIGDSMKPQESLSSLISSVDTKCLSNSLTLQSDNNIKPNIGSTFEVKEPSTNICFLESDDNKSDGEGNSQFVTGMSSGSSDIPVMSDYDCLKSLKTHNLPKDIEENQDKNETTSYSEPKPANSLLKSKAEKVLLSKESSLPITHNISTDSLDSKVNSFSLTDTNDKYKLNSSSPKLTMNYSVPLKCSQISTKSKISSGYECLKKILHPYSPKEIKKNHMFIVKITDNEFCCVLCKAKLFITKNVDSTISMFCDHFNGKRHVQNIKNQIKLKDISDTVKPQETLSSLNSPVESKFVSDNLTLQSDNNINPNIASTLEVKEPSTNICFLESDNIKSEVQGNSQFTLEINASSFNIPVMSDYDWLNSLLNLQNLTKDIEENQDENETRSCNKPKPANGLAKSKAEKVLLSKKSSLPITHNISTDSLDSKVNSFSQTDTNDKYKLNSSTPKLTMNYSVPLKCSQISTKSKISSDYECLKKILHPYSPKEIKENHMFIVKITDNEFCCVLCKVKLFITKNVDNTINMFCQHFNGKRHVENIKNQIKLKDISDTVKPQETLSSLNSPVESKFVSDNLTLQSDNNINPNIASTLEVKEPSTNICFLESDDIKSEVQGNSQFTLEINASSFNIPVMSDYDCLKLLIYQDLTNEVEENIYRSRKLDSNLEKLEYENNVEKNDEHTFISEEPNSNLSTPQSFVSCISSEMSSVGAPVVSDFDVFKQLFILNVPKEVEENQSFIEKRSDKLFVCNLCETKFYIFPDANYTLELFHLHFINKKHVRKVSSKQSEQKYAPDEMIEPKECSISTPLSLLHCTNPVMDPEANFGTAEAMDGYKSTDISSPSSDVKTFSDFDCLLNLLAPSLPKEVEENQMFIVKINDKMFECTLCKVKGYISHHIKKTVEKFCKHFTSETHAVNVMAYNNCWQKCVTGDVKPIETLPESVSFVESERSQTQPTNDVSKNVIVQDNYLQSVIAKLSPSCSNDAVISDYQYLKQILSPYLPKDIEESQAFVKVTDKELQCMLCDKTFVILPKVEQTVHPFCLHLISDKHKKKHHIEKHRKNINNAFVDSGKIILKFLTLFIFYVDYDFDDSAIRLYDVNILSNIIYVEPLKYFLRNNSNFISDFVRSQKIIHPYLPQTLESNEFIVTKNGYFQCRLCKVNITGWFDSDNIEHKCCEHFTSSDHIINVLAVLATFNLEVMYQEVQLDSKNDHVKELFYPCKVPDIVEQNKNHLVESGKQFICSWCGCKIAISANICDRIINFCQHFNNAEHSGSATRYKDEMQLSVLNSLKLLLLSGSIPQIIEENLDYLVRIGEDYLCNVCNMKIKKAFTPSCTISNFVQHLSNLRHIQSVDALSKKNKKHQ